MLLKSGIVLYRWFWQVSMSILCVVMHILCVYASDSVTRVNDSTRVTISGDLDSTRVIFRKMVTRLESRFSQNHSTRVTVNDSRLKSVSFLQNLLSSWWTNPLRLHTKKWAFFASLMIKIAANFLFCLSICAMLHFKDQVSPTCIEGDLRFYFHWVVSKTQYTDRHLIGV